MPTKTLLNLANTMQAANLVGTNVKSLKKKKQNTKDIMNLGVTNIVGTSFVKLNADLIAGL